MPTSRVALGLALCALSVLVAPLWVAGTAVNLLALAWLFDIYQTFRSFRTFSIERSVPSIVARGVAEPFTIVVSTDGRRTGPGPRLRQVRQPAPPDVEIGPVVEDAPGCYDVTLTGNHRGRHRLPPPALRTVGPLGLAARTTLGSPGELVVYPDLPAAHRLARAVRRGTFREAGVVARGPLGLGTEFESVREYLPDDDVRQVNWRATERLGRPMSNQYRVEQDRDVVCVVDTGRVMASPIDLAADGANGPRARPPIDASPTHGRAQAPTAATSPEAGTRLVTRLDLAIDAAVAVAAVADVVGDRCGVVAVGRDVQRQVPPRRRGADAVVQALFDLEPTSATCDFGAAFRLVGEGKRALVLVFTDLVDVAAARLLLEALPSIARRHHVLVVAVAEPGVDAALRRPPRSSVDVYAAAAALDVSVARDAVVSRLRALGVEVVSVPAHRLAAACVASYLRAKARARL